MFFTVTFRRKHARVSRLGYCDVQPAVGYVLALYIAVAVDAFYVVESRAFGFFFRG